MSANGTAPMADFVAAMGQHVSSVCVITTCHAGERFGLTATAVSSVCASPPRLLVCINKSGISHDKVAAAGGFCVNVLNEDQEQVAKSFAGMLGREADRFAQGEWHEFESGSPFLASACAVFDCRIVQQLDQFTHSIFIGEVVAARSGAGGEALLYGARRFRNLRKGFSPVLPHELEPLHF